MTAPATFAEAVAAVRKTTPHDPTCGVCQGLAASHPHLGAFALPCNCTKPQRESASIAKGVEAALAVACRVGMTGEPDWGQRAAIAAFVEASR